MRKFAISDIHGCNRTFRALLQHIAFSPEDELYLLGDYIDRGPDSKGVFDTIFELQTSGHTVHCLRGNHEEMLLDCFIDEQFIFHWTASGGEETLQSFGVESPDEIPDVYLDFIKHLPLVFQIDDCILVHAGLSWESGSPFLDTEALLWVRDWYQHLNYAWLGPRFVVHGHTPRERYILEKQQQVLAHYRYQDIDGGCFLAKNHPETDFGWLCAFELGSKALFFQRNVE